MIICPKCETLKSELLENCKQCGFSPALIDNVVSYAPELAKSNDGFPPESFQKLATIEENSFWFVARNRLILWVLNKYFPKLTSLLEIGCGTGFVLSAVSRNFPGARLVGCEIYTNGLAFASQRLPGTELMQADARFLPFQAEFEVVAAFDVIEHIEEDQLVLANLFRATKPGGACVITVPQHQWLWSPVDEEACHKRRYSAEELRRKLISAGFEISMSTSFVSLLLPLLWAVRFSDSQQGVSRASRQLNPGSFFNFFLEKVMCLELLAIKMGVRWPLGGSLLIVARRPL